MPFELINVIKLTVKIASSCCVVKFQFCIENKTFPSAKKGITKHHRLSYEPVKKVLGNN